MRTLCYLLAATAMIAMAAGMGEARDPGADVEPIAQHVASVAMYR